LTIDDDLSWRLTRNWLKWLHDFGVWISHSLTLFGIKALIDIWVSEVVLTHDLDIMVSFLKLLKVFIDLGELRVTFLETYKI
jgi:hypothetical protein